ncbi:polysaccharide pyruvyl transferase family protein [Psychroflexus tropicus]|uniref:polysaccharide pyruvyl transferase family protein n=1 Tax=Psychroflexus tropicus TaxID=197345 RepID=UPI00037EF8F4|nr:polysaccharide pyruvyl transferase family protein [Psychroflexus tropicus]
MINIHYYKSELKAEFKYLQLNLKWLFTQKRKAIYIGCTGQGNLGDESVLQASIILLKSKYFIYPISYIKPTSGKYLRRLLFKNVDSIILGGGTVIKKKQKESYLKLFSQFHEQYPNAELKVLGSGVADPELASLIGFSTDKLAWKNVLNKASFIGVRGVRSKLELSRWGVEREIKIVHDLAIYFKKYKSKSKQKKKRMGVNFCNIIGRIYGLDQKSVENFARDIVIKLINDGWEVWLYPTVSSDIGYMKSLFEKTLLEKLNIYENTTNINESLDFLESLDFFLGQRLHSVIFSAITYTPFIAIEYESKTSDFLETLGLEKYSHRTDNLSSSQVFSEINKYYKEIDSIQTKLFDCISKAHKEQKQLIFKF